MSFQFSRETRPTMSKGCNIFLIAIANSSVVYGRSNAYTFVHKQNELTLYIMKLANKPDYCHDPVAPCQSSRLKEKSCRKQVQFHLIEEETLDWLLSTIKGLGE